MRAPHPGLGDLDDLGRHERRQPREDPPVDLERAQVAGIDADHLGPGVERTRHLGFAVHLDQRHQADRQCPLRQRDQRILIQRSHDQQRHIGAVGTGLPQLVGADHEVLAQQRHRHRAPDRGQVLQAATEAPRLGEHADDGSPARLVVARQRGRVGDAGQFAPGRAGPLHLGDDRHVRPPEQVHHVARRGGPPGGLLEPVQRRVSLPDSEIGTDPFKDLVEHAHAVP